MCNSEMNAPTFDHSQAHQIRIEWCCSSKQIMEVSVEPSRPQWAKLWMNQISDLEPTAETKKI